MPVGKAYPETLVSIEGEELDRGVQQTDLDSGVDAAGHDPGNSGGDQGCRDSPAERLRDAPSSRLEHISPKRWRPVLIDTLGETGAEVQDSIASAANREYRCQRHLNQIRAGHLRLH